MVEGPRVGERRDENQEVLGARSAGNLPWLHESTEAEFMYAYETAGAPAVQRRLGTTWRRMGGGVAMAMRHDPTGYWSKALGFGFQAPVTQQLVDEVVHFYRSAGTASATLQLAPSVLPERWPEMAARAGLEPGDAIVKLGCGIDDVRLAQSPTGLTVRAVAPDEAAAWAAVTLRGFGFPLGIGFEEMVEATATSPHFRPFAAWEGEEMVAGAVLFLHGEVGSLNAGSTLPGHRNRGAQSALIAARVAAAREAGCTRVVAETGNPAAGTRSASFDNLHRLGLEPVYVRQNWVWRRSS